MNGVKGASAIRAADLIPGRESVKQVYQGKPGEAVKLILQNLLKVCLWQQVPD